MKHATKAAIANQLGVMVTLAIGFGGGGTAAWLALEGGKLSLLWWIVFVIITIASSVAFIWLLTDKSYSCPKCKDGRTKFTYDESDAQFLSCDSCKYSEATRLIRGD